MPEEPIRKLTEHPVGSCVSSRVRIGWNESGEIARDATHMAKYNTPSLMSRYTMGLNLRSWNHFVSGSRRALRSSALNAWLVTNLCIISTRYEAVYKLWSARGGLCKRHEIV